MSWIIISLGLYRFLLHVYAVDLAYTECTHDAQTADRDRPAICYYETACTSGKNPPTCKPGGYEWAVGANQSCHAYL